MLLLPGDLFATRRVTPVLQQLERPESQDVSVNDAFKPLSRFFDRVWRPEQLPSALLGAMRVLTDPVWGPRASPTLRASRSMSLTPGCGASDASSPSRSAPTMRRISVKARDASSSMIRSASTAASGSVAATTRPAWARIAMAETW